MSTFENDSVLIIDLNVALYGETTYRGGGKVIVMKKLLNLSISVGDLQIWGVGIPSPEDT